MFRVVAFRLVSSAAAISVLLGMTFAHVLHPIAYPLGDFRAAYCESRAAAHGLDPYRAATIAPCELRAAGVSSEDNVAASDAELTLESSFSVEPLAPFTLAIFAPLALLDYGVAARAYLVIGLLLVALAVYALRCLTKLPTFGLVVTFSVGACIATFAHGTLVPVTLASICVAAVLLRRGEDGWAGLVAAGTMIDPLVGFAVCGSLALYRPRTRLPILISIGVLILLSAAALGPSGSAEYYFDVLPATLLAQTFDGGQYGVGYLLHAAGLSGDASIRAGLVWDVLVVATAIPIARRYALVFRSASAYATVPAAVVLVGGTSLDLSHVALALPACCLALVSLPGARLRALAAIVLIATPWPNLADALSRLPFATLKIAFDRGSDAAILAMKTPTWFGLLLLLYVVTRSNATPVALRVRARADER